MLYPRPARLLTVSVEIGDSKMEALIDGAAQLNLLSASVAKERDIQVRPLSRLMAEAANGTKMTIYGTASVNVIVIDSRRRRRKHLIPFVVADIPKFPMYLGLPWIDAENPKLNYLSRRMLHRGEKAKNSIPYHKVAIEDAEQFARTMYDQSSDIYFCSIAYLDDSEQHISNCRKDALHHGNPGGESADDPQKPGGCDRQKGVGDREGPLLVDLRFGCVCTQGQ